VRTARHLACAGELYTVEIAVNRPWFCGTDEFRCVGSILEQVSQTTASGGPAIPVAGPSGKCL